MLCETSAPTPARAMLLDQVGSSRAFLRIEFPPPSTSFLIYISLYIYVYMQDIYSIFTIYIHIYI